MNYKVIWPKKKFFAKNNGKVLMIFYNLHAATKRELAEAKVTIENLKTTLNGKIYSIYKMWL